MVSMLRSEGHTEPQHYPIWMVWDEVDIVRVRSNRNTRTQATVMLMAVGTAQTGGQKAIKAFNKFLEKFSDGEEH